MAGKGVVIFYLGIVSIVLTWIIVALRLYVRVILKRSYGVDDWFLIASVWPFCHSYHEPKCKTQKDLDSLTADETENTLKCYFVSELLWVAGTGMIKLSFALTLRRFLAAGWQYWCFWASVSTNLVINVFYFCWLAFDCSPVSYFWRHVQRPHGGSCKPVSMLMAATYAHAIILLANDVGLAILPIFIVKKMHMNLSAKVAVVSILSMGSIPSISTIIRIAYVQDILKNDNFLTSTANFAIWSIIELSTGIIAVSATALRPLAEKLAVFKFFSTFSGNRAISGGGVLDDVPLHKLDSSRMTSTEQIIASNQKHGNAF